jgi:hypothetical protein
MCCWHKQFGCALHVLQTSYSLEMGRIAALANPAKMVDFKAVMDGSDAQLIHGPVNADRSADTGDTRSTIAVVVSRAVPNPAWRRMAAVLYLHTRQEMPQSEVRISWKGRNHLSFQLTREARNVAERGAVARVRWPLAFTDALEPDPFVGVSEHPKNGRHEDNRRNPDDRDE